MKTINWNHADYTIEIKEDTLDDVVIDTPLVLTYWPPKKTLKISSKVKKWRYKADIYKYAFATIFESRILYLQKNVNYPQYVLDEIIAYENNQLEKSWPKVCAKDLGVL